MTIMDVEAISSQQQTIGWKYGECVFEAQQQGANLSCLVHDHNPAWETAQALGGKPPCWDLVHKHYQAALRGGNWGQIPDQLHPMMAQILQGVPTAFRDGDRRVAKAFFNERRVQVSTRDLQVWKAGKSEKEMRAVAWLVEHKVRRATWATIKPTIARLGVQEGVTEPQLRIFYRTFRAESPKVSAMTVKAVRWLVDHQIDTPAWERLFKGGIYTDPIRTKELVQAGISPQEISAYIDKATPDSAHFVDWQRLFGRAPIDVVQSMLRTVPPEWLNALRESTPSVLYQDDPVFDHMHTLSAKHFSNLVTAHSRGLTPAQWRQEMIEVSTKERTLDSQAVADSVLSRWASAAGNI